MPRGNPALSKPLNVSAELEAVVGKGPMARGQVVKKLWEYIKANNLQNPTNKRNIKADSKLKSVFGGKEEVNMFEMTKLVSKHLSLYLESTHLKAQFCVYHSLRLFCVQNITLIMRS